MFSYTKAFNQPINSSGGNWNTANVTSMAGMFMSAEAFNQDIKDWNKSSLTDMDNMFLNAQVFNQDLSTWVIDSNITSHVNYDVGATSWVLPGRKPTILP
ncbi:hypothetical protein D3C87_1427740 [compost metagenome]